jgi:CO dehydrogenase maturation factor
MKLAVTGKGGVGKTTFCTLLSVALVKKGHKVLLIDADPDMNLATVIGIPEKTKITPIVELKELIAERTGVEPGKPAPFFKMNPRVDDIPDRFCVSYNGIKLIVMGTIRSGGGGCACPENAFLKSLLSYLVVATDEWVILDMEAGIEHLGRGTAIGVDCMIVVVEPNRTSIETADRIKRLAGEIGIKRVLLVGNKTETQDEREFLTKHAEGHEIIGFLDTSDDVRNLSRTGGSSWDLDMKSMQQIEFILEKLTAVGAPK